MNAADTLEFDGQRYLDGRASVPRALGWMRGAPPPADRLVTFESDRFLDFPQIRWTLSHMRELAPTVNVRRGDTLLPGYSYRNMWWVSHNELDAFEGRGIHGQRLYVAPKAEMVVARFASHPVASSAANDPITLPQLLALGRMLRS